MRPSRVLWVTYRPAGRPRAMGGGGSASRRVTFEADENDNVTVVKGVRVSAGGGREDPPQPFSRAFFPQGELPHVPLPR